MDTILDSCLHSTSSPRGEPAGQQMPHGPSVSARYDTPPGAFMLDLPRLQRIRLSPRPLTQRIVGRVILSPNYNLFKRVPITIEGKHHIPPESVIFAMNHTDRFNYFPFMYKMWREENRFMSVWVKGKYYETKLVGAFMEHTNNLPAVSRGYIISKDFALTIGRPPTEGEYSTLRTLVNADAEPGKDPATVDLSALGSTNGTDGARGTGGASLLDELFSTPRSILGVDFSPVRHTYAQAVNETFRQMMACFVDLNRRAFDLGLDLLVFPQGTRSIRLSQGRIGMIQVALHQRKTIIPVGCNGSDIVHPGSSMIVSPGPIEYRIGKPIRYEDLSEFHINEDFAPFSAEAEHRYRERFQGAVDVVMDRINPLLDSKYQYSEDLESGGVRGTDRFL